jgi:uncharacterized YigZ family protein
MKADTNEKDIYYTIEKEESAEIKIKKSRFIASVFSVNTKQNAMFFIEKIKSKYYDSTHNCYAYKIGKDGLEYRAFDDGEPSGSAGKPILFTINKHNLSDVLVVVTRYYGGTKLGVGGLARAYSEAADSALSICVKKSVFETTNIRVHCTYEDYDVVKRILNEYALNFQDDFHDAVEIIASIPNSKTKEFCSKISSATKARAGTIIIK